MKFMKNICKWELYTCDHYRDKRKSHQTTCSADRNDAKNPLELKMWYGMVKHGATW